MEIAGERRESELAYLVGSLGQDGHAVIDNGSRSIELVSKDRGVLRHHVANLGYRVAYETFFERTVDPAAAVGAFQEQLRQHAAKAPFMKGMRRLVGVEFGEMANGPVRQGPGRRAHVHAGRTEGQAREDYRRIGGRVSGAQDNEGHRPFAAAARRGGHRDGGVRLHGAGADGT